MEEGLEIKYVKRLVVPGLLNRNESREDWLCWHGKEHVEDEKKDEKEKATSKTEIWNLLRAISPRKA
jgi:hypothetical protein